MEFQDPPRKHPSLDLTPMVSIIFLLIIFFLVAGTVRSPSFWEISLPTSSSEDKVDPKMLSVYLNEQGHFAYEKQRIDLKFLQEKLKQKDADAILQIHADQQVDTLKLVQLLNTLQNTIVNRIVLVTQAP